MRLTDVAIFVTLTGGCAIDKGVRFMKALSISDSYPLRGTPIMMAEDFDEPLSPLWEACDVAETSKEFQKKQMEVVSHAKTRVH
jgi:hypothetical protein